MPVNWAKGIDLKTGRPVLDSTKLTGESKGNVKNICPTLEGGKNQQPAAYSPLTKLFYVPTNNMCMDYAGAKVSYIAGAPYIGATTPYYPGEGGNMGAFIAYRPRHRQEGVADQGALSGLERRARHRRRSGLLRHARRLVQVGRRPHRHGALQVQGGVGRDRESHHVPGSRWQAVRGHLCRVRRRLVPHLGRRHVQ